MNVSNGLESNTLHCQNSHEVNITFCVWTENKKLTLSRTRVTFCVLCLNSKEFDMFQSHVRLLFMLRIARIEIHNSSSCLWRQTLNSFTIILRGKSNNSAHFCDANNITYSSLVHHRTVGKLNKTIPSFNVQNFLVFLIWQMYASHFERTHRQLGVRYTYSMIVQQPEKSHKA